MFVEHLKVVIFDIFGKTIELILPIYGFWVEERVIENPR
jgi:hypothetical protein